MSHQNPDISSLVLARWLLSNYNMNSAIFWEQPQPIIGNDVVPSAVHQLRFEFKHTKKESLGMLRALFLLVILVLLFNSDHQYLTVSNFVLGLYLGLYGVSVIGLFFIKKEWLENKLAFSAIFLMDICFISAGLFLAGLADTDLFLVFFTTVFISALSQDVKSVCLVAGVSCLLYGFLEFRETGNFLVGETNFLVRFPFLIVAATMSGFLAMDTKQHKEESERLQNLNRILAAQADSSALKLTETNRKLKSLLEYHHCVLSSIKTGIIVVQKDGKVRTFNSGARQITGCIEAEMAELGLDQFPENLLPLARALQRTLVEEKTFLIDHLELKSTRSEVVPVNLETSLLRGVNGQVIGAIATLKDISLLKQLERQLIRSERFSALGEMAAGWPMKSRTPSTPSRVFPKGFRLRSMIPPLKSTPTSSSRKSAGWIK